MSADDADPHCSGSEHPEEDKQLLKKKDRSCAHGEKRKKKHRHAHDEERQHKKKKRKHHERTVHEVEEEEPGASQRGAKGCTVHEEEEEEQGAAECALQEEVAPHREEPRHAANKESKKVRKAADMDTVMNPAEGMDSNADGKDSKKAQKKPEGRDNRNTEEQDSKKAHRSEGKKSQKTEEQDSKKVQKKPEGKDSKKAQKPEDRGIKKTEEQDGKKAQKPEDREIKKTEEQDGKKAQKPKDRDIKKTEEQDGKKAQKAEDRGSKRPRDAGSSKAQKAEEPEAPKGISKAQKAEAADKKHLQLKAQESLAEEEEERGTELSESDPENDKKQRPAKSTPKKQDGFLTREAACAILSSCQLTQSEFHDFVCARCFDVFSGGMYRKFLVQSRSAKEAWAFNVQLSISKVQKLGKMMACVVNSVKLAEEQDGGGLMLGSALSACMNSSTPPVSRPVASVRQALARCLVDGPVQCGVTGAVLEDQCIEVRASSKSSQPAAEQGGVLLHPPVVVHPDFEHFFNMLWYCSKIEHVVRHMGKCWMEDFQSSCEQLADGEEPGSEEEGGVRMQAMCEKYSKDNEEVIADMHAAFIYAYEFVLESVYAHQCMAQPPAGAVAKAQQLCPPPPFSAKTKAEDKPGCSAPPFSATPPKTKAEAKPFPAMPKAEAKPSKRKNMQDEGPPNKKKPKKDTPATPEEEEQGECEAPTPALLSEGELDEDDEEDEAVQSDGA